MGAVKKICRKLKSAELLTPIVVVGLSPSCRGEVFDYADHVLLLPESESLLLDTLDEIMGTPPPLFLSQQNEVEVVAVAVDSHQSEESPEKLSELEAEIAQLKETAESATKALEAQRNFYKPKLKALLEGQKVDQHNQEFERLRVKLSEVEARLLDREARIKELEQMRKTHKAKLDQLLESHQKAQQSLRSFYQDKIRTLSPNKMEEESAT